MKGIGLDTPSLMCKTSQSTAGLPVCAMQRKCPSRQTLQCALITLTGVHFATAIEHLAKVIACERPIEHLARSKSVLEHHIDLRVCAGLHKDGSYSYLSVANAHGKV